MVGMHGRAYRHQQHHYYYLCAATTPIGNSLAAFLFSIRLMIDEEREASWAPGEALSAPLWLPENTGQRAQIGAIRLVAIILTQADGTTTNGRRVQLPAPIKRARGPIALAI